MRWLRPGLEHDPGRLPAVRIRDPDGAVDPAHRGELQSRLPGPDHRAGADRRLGERLLHEERAADDLAADQPGPGLRGHLHPALGRGRRLPPTGGRLRFHLGALEDVAEVSQEAVTAPDGKIYAIPTHTDTRGIWYHKGVFADAGLPEDWEPGSWEDILEAARTIKEASPDVAPLFIFSGMP